MPGEFHLSIKNTQRKIVDVRDLFKDLTKEELEILEKAKLRSEEEKRLKDFRENENYYMSQKESKYKKKHESNLVTYSSKPSLQDMDKSTSASDLLVTSAYVDEKEANLIRSIKIRDSNRQKSSKIKEQERSIIKNDKKFLKKFNKLVLDSNNSKINIKINKKLCSFKAKNSSQDAVGNPKLDSTSQSFSSRSNSESSLKNSINIKVSLEATFATKKALWIYKYINIVSKIES